MNGITDERLQALVEKDRAIANKASSATLALMEHRWNAVQELGNASEYARALGVHPSGVQRYARAWEVWRERKEDVFFTPVDALELAGMGEQKRAAAEAVAEAKGVGVKAVREHHMADVREVQRVMREVPDLEESIDKGRRTAQAIETVRKSNSERQAERRRTTPAAYLDLENHIGRANRSLTEALGIARTEQFDSQYTGLLLTALDKTRAVLDLVNLALTGKAPIDWDAELARLGAE